MSGTDFQKNLIRFFQDGFHRIGEADRMAQVAHPVIDGGKVPVLSPVTAQAGYEGNLR